MPRILHRHPLACAATIALVVCGLVLAGAAAAQAQAQAQGPEISWYEIGAGASLALTNLVSLAAGVFGTRAAAARRLHPVEQVPPAPVPTPSAPAPTSSPSPSEPLRVVAELPPAVMMLLGEIREQGRGTDRRLREVARRVHDQGTHLTAISVWAQGQGAIVPSKTPSDSDEDSDNPPPIEAAPRGRRETR